jgi:hypothetical protein
MEALAWVATISILLTYFAMNKWGRANLFNWANFLGSFVLGTFNGIKGIWPSVTLNAFFGLIGFYGILTARARK